MGWFGLLVIVLVLLKAFGVIAISWWWLAIAALLPFVFAVSFLLSMLGLMVWLELDKK